MMCMRFHRAAAAAAAAASEPNPAPVDPSASALETTTLGAPEQCTIVTSGRREPWDKPC